MSRLHGVFEESPAARRVSHGAVPTLACRRDPQTTVQRQARWTQYTLSDPGRERDVPRLGFRIFTDGMIDGDRECAGAGDPRRRAAETRASAYRMKILGPGDEGQAGAGLISSRDGEGGRACRAQPRARADRSAARRARASADRTNAVFFGRAAYRRGFSRSARRRADQDREETAVSPPRTARDSAGSPRFPMLREQTRKRPDRTSATTRSRCPGVGSRPLEQKQIPWKILRRTNTKFRLHGVELSSGASATTVRLMLPRPCECRLFGSGESRRVFAGRASTPSKYGAPPQAASAPATQKKQIRPHRHACWRTTPNLREGSRLPMNQKAQEPVDASHPGGRFRPRG